MKALTIAVAICICILVIAVPVSAQVWAYTSSNASASFTVPAGITLVSLQITGAGGGAAGSYSNLPSWAYAGLGGNQGQHGSYLIPVIPGATFPLVVGAPGAATSNSSTLSLVAGKAGGTSSAFGHIMAGGAGGVTKYPDADQVGGAGQEGFFSATKYATDGTNGVAAGGVAGTGYGAGGGGPGGNNGATSTGGAGASGLVRITSLEAGDFPGNLPNFTADVETISYGTVVHFQDLSTLNEGSDLSYLWDFGDGTTSPTAGNVSHVFAYMGSFDISLTINSTSGPVTRIRSSYINVITQEQIQTPYFPSSVTFTVVDPYGNGVSGARVNATYVTSTFPDAVAYLTDMYKIDASIAAQMLSTSTTMTGLTGGDGSISFSMHPSLQYNITVTSSSGNVVTAVYPKESTYTVWLPASTTVENLYEQINATLTFTEPNASFFTLGTVYQDHAGKTSALLFYVNTSNGTSVYSTSIAPGTSNQSLTYTLQNVRGQGYYWGIRGTRTGGNITMERGVTGKGPNGVLVDLHLPDVNYYQWIAVLLLFLLSSLASKAYVRFFAILIPLFGMMFWWFGWLPGTLMIAILPFCLFLGVLYYMKGSLMENYGTGGSGSMLMNIVVFLIIFQLMIGFVSELGVFNHQAVITPKNQFSNIDLTDLQQNVSQIGGINDPLQSASAITSGGYAALKVFMSMLSAVFVVGLFLSEMFPQIPIAFIAILQAGIWILYVITILKILFRSGSETDL